MDNIPAKEDYDGVTVPATTAQTHSAAELNDRRVELQGAVSDSALILAPADAGQLSKAMYANGVAASSMIDSGAAGVITLTPKTGASGLRVATPVAPDYSALNGAIFNFQANATNAGNVTVNVGQTSGIGAKSLFLEDGTSQVPAGMIVAGRYYSVRYDAALAAAAGAFVLISEGGTQSSQAEGTSNITTTSASFVDMTNMSVTLTILTGKALLMFSAAVGNSTDTGDVVLRFDIDGTSQEHTIIVSGAGGKPADWTDPASMQFLVTGLSAGSHTFKVQWHRGTGGIAASNGATYPRVFTVQEK